MKNNTSDGSLYGLNPRTNPLLALSGQTVRRDCLDRLVYVNLAISQVNNVPQKEEEPKEFNATAVMPGMESLFALLAASVGGTEK